MRVGVGVGVRGKVRVGVRGRARVRPSACACARACMKPNMPEPALEVVEEAVGVDEEACRAAREERAPPPSVVLDGELEVGEG